MTASSPRVLKSFSTNLLKENMFSKEKLDQMADEPETGVHKVRSTVHVALHPRYLNQLALGLISYFNKLIHCWHVELNGVIMGYGKLQLRRPTGNLMNEEAHIHVDVLSDFWVFRPKLGTVLRGVVEKRSPTHISCLVHGSYNIPCYKSVAAGRKTWLGDRIKLKSVVQIEVVKADMSQRVPLIVGSLIKKLADPSPADDVAVEELSEADWLASANADSQKSDDSGIDSAGKNRIASETPIGNYSNPVPPAMSPPAQSAGENVDSESTKSDKKKKKKKKDKEKDAETTEISTGTKRKSVDTSVDMISPTADTSGSKKRKKMAEMTSTPVASGAKTDLNFVDTADASAIPDAEVDTSAKKEKKKKKKKSKEKVDETADTSVDQQNALIQSMLARLKK